MDINCILNGAWKPYNHKVVSNSFLYFMLRLISLVYSCNIYYFNHRVKSLDYFLFSKGKHFRPKEGGMHIKNNKVVHFKY